MEILHVSQASVWVSRYEHPSMLSLTSAFSSRSRGPIESKFWHKVLSRSWLRSRAGSFGENRYRISWEIIVIQSISTAGYNFSSSNVHFMTENNHRLRVSSRVSFESANDKVYTSIAHVFVTTNMSVSFHVQWFNAGQRRRSRVIRELHVRCPCVLSTSFLRGMNWSSCSTGFVLVCRELVVTLSLCVYMFVFLVISVENWSWTL